MTCNNCSNNCSNLEEYEEYIPNKEYPLGGFFKIGSEVFKVVRDNGSCNNCEFITSKCPKEVRCSIMRRTNNEVCFILYDTLEDNE